MVFYVIDRSMSIVATMTNDVPNALMIDDSSGGQNIILTNGVATGSYSFKTDPYHRDSVYIKAGNYIAFKDKYSKYRLYTIITVSGDTELTVTCEDIGLDLINEMSGAWDFGNVDLTLDFFLNRVFGGTGWKIVYETAGIKDTTRNLSYTTVTDTRLKRLESVMSAFGYEGDFEIKMSGAHVTEQIFHVYQKILNANSSSPVQRFMNDMNLISLNREESIADLYTAVLPTGGTVDGKTVDISQIVYDDGRFFTTDNDNVLYDRVSAEKWSRFSGTVNEKSTDDHYIMGHYTSSTTSASALFEEAKAQLIANCDAKISVEAKLLELDADLGDYIEIVDHSKTTDILLKARVQSVTNYYTQVGEDTGTLANYQLIEDTSQEFRDMLERIKTQIKSVTGSTVEYAVSDQGSIPPTDGWSSDKIPTVGDGQFLWTRTTTTFSDNTSTVAYSISKNGVNGRSLISTKTHYAIGSDTTTIPSKWQEEWPKELTSGDYLWTRNTFYYSSGDPTVSYTITYYPKDGNNYTSITNYFLASSLSSGVTAEEIIKNGSKNPADQKVTAASQYLWTVEELSFENYDGTVELQKTTPHIISVYSSDGVGIIDNGIIEWYQVTNSMTEAPTSWSKEPQLMTPDKKYLWNYEETIYSNGKHVRSDPVVIGVYGDKGEKGESSYTHIRYCDEYPDDFDKTYTGTTGKNPMFIGVYTGPLATAPTTIMAYQWSQIRGNQGPTGNGILSTTYFYAVTTDNVKPAANKVTSVDMPPLDSVNKYLWRKTITDYSDPSVEDKVVVELQAVYGDTGLKGDPGKQGESAILLYIDSSNGTTFKNSSVATIFTVTVYVGDLIIDTSTKLKQVFGSNAYLQWTIKKHGETGFTNIPLNDPRLNDEGFIFIISASDIKFKAVFNCELNF